MRSLTVTVLTLLAVLILASPGRAEVPSQINYQGILTDADGTLLDGPYDLEFRIFAESSGGDPLWTESHAAVPVENGLFNVILGNLGPELFDDAERYMEVVVEGETISPRMRITSVAYAHQAAVADLANEVDWANITSMPEGFADGIDDVGGTGDGHSLDADDGDPVDAVYVDSEGRVGIGTTTPHENLVVGDDTGYNAAGIRIVVSEASPTGTPGITFWKEAGNYAYLFWMNDEGKIRLGSRVEGTSYNALHVDRDQIGIGTSDPTSMLHVVGDGPEEAVITGEYTGPSGDGGMGVYGKSQIGGNGGYGGYFVGGLCGVQGRAYANGPTGGNLVGVFGFASGAPNNRTGVHGYAGGSGGTNIGVYGDAASGDTNWAGYFDGDVRITGTLNPTTAAVQIDYPLDPANKYINHSLVQSQEMLNVYSGNVILDSHGSTWVELPEWFETMNQGFRYQLTAIGAPGPNLYVAEEILGNRFRIAGGESGMKVSWQVTGTRSDPYAEAHRIPVVQEKPAREMGTYLHPELYGQPETMAVDYHERLAELRE